jgi:hypothetical protein
MPLLTLLDLPYFEISRGIKQGNCLDKQKGNIS